LTAETTRSGAQRKADAIARLNELDGRLPMRDGEWLV
jgi:hypothetical protein